jgi:hypothetical protein
MPSSVPHEQGITCLRGSGLRPFAILKWPESLVSTSAESVLGHSPSDTFRVEVVSELAAKFQKMEDWPQQLEWPATRIYDVLVRLPPSRA